MMPSWASVARRDGGSANRGESSLPSSLHPSQWTSVEQPVRAEQPTAHWKSINEKTLALFLFRQHRSDPRLWEVLHPDLKLDRSVVQAALEADAVSDLDADLPQEIQEDTEFWQRMISINPVWWDRLPRVQTNNLQLAQNMTTFRSLQQIANILTRFRSLQSDSGFWLKLVTAGFADGNFLVEMASPEILQDKTVMLAAVAANFNVFDVLSAPLNRDRDLVQAALRTTIAAVLYIPAFVQRLYPDIIGEAIGRSTKSEVWEWHDYIGNDVWSDRRVALAWVSIGGDYLRNRFPVYFKDDKELFLLIAEHNWSEFCLCSARLRRNKSFMLQAVAKNSMLLWDGENGLHRDYDLALIAFANSDTLYQSFDMMDRSDAAFLNGFWYYLEARLQVHSNFMLILAAMSADSSFDAQSKSNLELLNQGTETSMKYKRLLAELLGVPVERELAQLRNAHRSLREWHLLVHSANSDS